MMASMTRHQEQKWDFYAVQRRQWQKTLFLFLILMVFYSLFIGLLSSAALITLGFFVEDLTFFSQNNLTVFLLVVLVLSFMIAAFHFYDAKMFGARFIRKRLQARAPDKSDRYHQRFINTVEEIRIAGGLPEVSAYILPIFAVNSLALMERNNQPSVLVTEGLLADFTRDELQSVVSHELAHILRGDTFYITLVCSLANFFEKIRQALEPEDTSPAFISKRSSRGGGPLLLYLATTISSIFMHLLSTLISRQREILADAAAVELCRTPKALARSIYKAHMKNSFVGDFIETYSPLYIVPPESKGITDGFFSRLFNSHPPLMSRIERLAVMANTSSRNIIGEIFEIQKNREKARLILDSGETRVASSEEPSKEDDAFQEDKIWAIRSPKGKWLGPMSLEETLYHKTFSPLIWTMNIPEGIEAPAREFPQIQFALRHLWHKRPVRSSRHNRCPRCRISFHDVFYEGVPVKHCPGCEGKLVDSKVMDRLISRKEIGFSPRLKEIAEEFRSRYMFNPIRTIKINASRSPVIFCPSCGSKMLPRPYSYHYVLPVDKCLHCGKIWFDMDELEILQVLIEDR